MADEPRLAMLTGVRVLVVDTLALPDQVLEETRIQRHSESTKSRDRED